MKAIKVYYSLLFAGFIMAIASCGSTKTTTNSDLIESSPAQGDLSIEKQYNAYNDSLYNRVEPIINLLIDNPTQTDQFLEREVFAPLKAQKQELSRATDKDWEQHFKEEAKRGVFNKKPHSIKLAEPEGEIKRAFAKSLELVIPIGLSKAKKYIIDSVGADVQLASKKDSIFDAIYIDVLEKKEKASILAFVEIEKRSALNLSTSSPADSVIYAGLAKGYSKQTTSNESGSMSSGSEFYISRAKEKLDEAYDVKKSKILNKQLFSESKTFAESAEKNNESKKDIYNFYVAYYQALADDSERIGDKDTKKAAKKKAQEYQSKLNSL